MKKKIEELREELGACEIAIRDCESVKLDVPMAIKCVFSCERGETSLNFIRKDKEDIAMEIDIVKKAVIKRKEQIEAELEKILEPEQPKYPKTYEKCCDILDVEPYSRSGGYKSDLITAFRNLFICRNAYWKIAGEQMGLGKPWKPNFLNPTKEIRYFIFCTGITIEKGQGLFPSNKILIFPTEEMCDAFYENFKELIEQCKELL